ncbi:MAG: hypothetical protein HRT87_10015, partial [Legionellales bacterium]|nr:hypothetical protein [Legionellales bacterium]
LAYLNQENHTPTTDVGKAIHSLKPNSKLDDSTNLIIKILDQSNMDFTDKNMDKKAGYNDAVRYFINIGAGLPSEVSATNLELMTRGGSHTNCRDGKIDIQKQHQSKYQNAINSMENDVRMQNIMSQINSKYSQNTGNHISTYAPVKKRKTGCQCTIL